MEQEIPAELKLLNEWQKRLGLDDWYIVLEANVDPDKMTLCDADGCISYTETTKAAKIQIINPEKRKGALRPFDFEETLLHELLHIKLCLLESGTDWEKKLQLRLLHMIIDDLSRAFVSAKHDKEKE